ncbi:MAG: hypothetical protein RL391_625 [Actinomycetota bacterium]|jgi:dipeptidyl aminopeptidase/acylaminoacyl peptidase
MVSYARDVTERTARPPVAFDDVVAGPEVGEPRPSPDGEWLAAVVAGWDGTAPEGRLMITRIDRIEWTRWSPFGVRSVRGMGGGTFDWLPDSSAVVVVDRAGSLTLLGRDGATLTLVEATDRVVSSPIVSPDGTRVAFVVDQAEIHVVDVDRPGRIERIDRGDFNFVIDPMWWRDRLVWQAWNVPDMPWDESSLVSTDGIVMSAPRRQIQQWRPSPNGTDFAWVDDASGWLNVVTGNGRRVSEAAEHAGPQWGERQRSWCWSPDGSSIAFTRNEGGFGRLCTIDTATGLIRERAKAVHGQLSWVGGRLTALRTGGKTPTQIVVYDTIDDEWERRSVLVSSSRSWADHWSMVEPTLVEITSSDGATLFARLFESPSERRGLLCWVHGGPTDQTPVSFQPRFNYWISRGYSVLVPDHRGSSGHGRAFADALLGRWGELDVSDVIELLASVQTSKGFRRENSAVLGASAGGMTALNLAAVASHLVAACVVSYPVSDIAALDHVTHRFEAHYNRTLVGTEEETIERSRVRSPSHRTDALAATPLLVLHGDADPVVPVEQSRSLVDEVRRAGGMVDYFEFAGEGHGFRGLDAKRDEYHAMEGFLSRHLRN